MFKNSKYFNKYNRMYVARNILVFGFIFAIVCGIAKPEGLMAYIGCITITFLPGKWVVSMNRAANKSYREIEAMQKAERGV